MKFLGQLKIGVILCTLLTFTTVLFGQTAKAPRVVEVENYLTNKTLEYVKGRFPGTPVLVSITIDPLRTDVGSNKRSNEDVLPYFSSSTVDVVDAWDDPGRPIEDLLVRIKSTNIRVSLPSRITDDQLTDLRDALFQNLSMIPGRDNINFVRKDWENPEPLPWLLLAIAGGALLLFLAGTYAVARTTTRQMGRILGEGSKIVNSPAPAMSITNPIIQKDNTSAGLMSSESDLHFNDMVKINEKIKHIANHLAGAPDFPTLQDMIDLDHAAADDPKFLGAIVCEFPKLIQDRFFMLSRHKGWLDAMVDPGRLNLNSYRFILKFDRRERFDSDQDWQELLILCWRLDTQLTTFIKSFNETEAMKILAAMPTSVSIPVARAAFPGSWGRLLDPNFRPGKIDVSRIAELKRKALELKPYHDPKMVLAFRHEKGVLSYLLTASISDERDIYEASKADSTIRLVRPPFYPILDLTDEELAKFVPSIPIDRWALALFNTSRDQRQIIEKHFSEKQRYLFVEALKRFDQLQPKREVIGEARENIGHHLKIYSQINFNRTDSSVAHPETTRDKDEDRHGFDATAA